MYVNSDDVIKCFFGIPVPQESGPRQLVANTCGRLRMWALMCWLSFQMPLSISLRHEDARANKRYRLSEDQFKKIALYDGLVQDDDIFPMFRRVRQSPSIGCLPQGPSLNARWHYMTAFSYGLALPWLNPEDLNEAEGNMARQPVLTCWKEACLA